MIDSYDVRTSDLIKLKSDDTSGFSIGLWNTMRAVLAVESICKEHNIECRPQVKKGDDDIFAFIIRIKRGQLDDKEEQVNLFVSVKGNGSLEIFVAVWIHDENGDWLSHFSTDTIRGKLPSFYFLLHAFAKYEIYLPLMKSKLRAIDTSLISLGES